MEKEVKLYMIMLGCRPEGRFTEQHDIFFGIGSSIKELIPYMKKFWPEAKGKIHIDAWREITVVDGQSVAIVEKKDEKTSNLDLFFINLGIAGCCVTPIDILGVDTKITESSRLLYVSELKLHLNVF